MRLSSRKPHEVTRSQQDRQEIRGKPHQRSVFSSFFSESHVQFINSISGGRKPRISPLRCASVEMTKGRAVLPSTVVAEQEPFFITLGGPKGHDSSVEKHFQEGTAEPQISPLRCASVEMTKGRAVLPSTVVAGQEPFFITLGGPKAHDSSVEKHFQEGTAEPQISPLRCASVEMTKGRAVLPGESCCWTGAVFHHLGWARRPMTPLSKNISKKGPRTADLSTALRFGRDDKGEGGASIESSC